MEAELDVHHFVIEKNHKGDARTSTSVMVIHQKTLKSQYGEFQIGCPKMNREGGVPSQKLIP